MGEIVRVDAALGWNEEHGQRPITGRVRAVPGQLGGLETEVTQLMAKGLRQFALFGGADEPDGTWFDPVGIGCPDGDGPFHAPFLIRNVRLGAGHRTDQGVELTLQGEHVLLCEGVCVVLPQSRQGSVFEALAHTHQARQTQAAEVLGQAVDRNGEFDELLEPSFGDVVLPARAQNVDAVIERTRRGCGHVGTGSTGRCAGRGEGPLQTAAAGVPSSADSVARTMGSSQGLPKQPLTLVCGASFSARFSKLDTAKTGMVRRWGSASRRAMSS